MSGSLQTAGYYYRRIALRRSYFLPAYFMFPATAAAVMDGQERRCLCCDYLRLELSAEQNLQLIPPDTINRSQRRLLTCLFIRSS